MALAPEQKASQNEKGTELGLARTAGVAGVQVYGGLLCIYFNARSIVNKLGWLEVTVTLYNPDIVGITESWCTEHVGSAEIGLEGYDVFRTDRRNGMRGGGVLLYIKSHLGAIQLDTKGNCLEAICCKMYNQNRDELVVAVVYKTNNPCASDGDLDMRLREWIRRLYGSNIVIMGDMNYPDIDWNNVTGTGIDRNSRLFIDCLDDGFLTQHVKSATRGQSCLDLVISRDPDIVEELTVRDRFANSDHNIIVYRIAFNVRILGSRRKRFEYGKADFSRIRKCIERMKWSGGTTQVDANSYWMSFRDSLLKVEMENVPAASVTDRRRRSMWMDKTAIAAVRRRQKMFSKYKNSNHPAYIRAEKEARISIKQARKSFESKLAKKIKTDSKSFYAYVRSKSKCRSGIGPLMSASGTITESDAEMCEVLNEYFSSVFTKENENAMPSPVQVYTGPASDELNDVQLSEDIVMKKLSLLRVDKSPGADALSPRYLREIRNEICQEVLAIWSMSLRDGVVPEDWKMANVCPIFKKGKRSDAANYRPVSLTSQLGKLLESVIRDSLVDHLDRFNLIRESQHGFRKGHSCQSNLLIFLDRITTWIDNGEPADAIYLDFAKAFDKVPHARLIQKLRGHGIGGKVLAWIREWLKERKQRVCINGVCSGWREVVSGVPQGSVLGPVLFLIFINDLDKDVANDILKFADDTKLFGRTGGVLGSETIQDDLERLYRWSTEWQMLFNITKCKVLHFGRNNANQIYYLNGIRLEECDSERDLGVETMSNLKASTQCRNACAKSIKVLGMINRTVVFKDKEILLCLYKSLVRPLLEYCTPVWSPHYIQDKSLIERVQHRFTRMIRGMRHQSYEYRLEMLGIWSLEERRNRADLIEVFKIMRGFSTSSLKCMFELNVGLATRGHSLKLVKHRCQSDTRKYFFCNRVVSRWNQLDQRAIDAVTVDSFKRNLTRIRTTRMGFFEDG